MNKPELSLWFFSIVETYRYFCSSSGRKIESDIAVWGRVIRVCDWYAQIWTLFVVTRSRGSKYHHETRDTYINGHFCENLSQLNLCTLLKTLKWTFERRCIQSLDVESWNVCCVVITLMGFLWFFSVTHSMSSNHIKVSIADAISGSKSLRRWYVTLILLYTMIWAQISVLTWHCSAILNKLLSIWHNSNATILSNRIIEFVCANSVRHREGFILTLTNVCACVCVCMCVWLSK